MDPLVQYLVALGLSPQAAEQMAAQLEGQSQRPSARGADVVEGSGNMVQGADTEEAPAITTNPMEERLRAVRMARERAEKTQAEPTNELARILMERDAQVKQRHPNYQKQRPMPPVNAGY